MSVKLSFESNFFFLVENGEYQKIILSYLKSKFIVKKIYYVSDGAHEKGFGIPAERHRSKS